MSARPMTSQGAHPDYLPRRVAVLGFERSGRALAEALLERGVSVAIGDRRDASQFPGLAPYRERGARFFFDGPAESFLERAEWLAISPGVPLDSPAVAAARSRGIPVLAELEIAWRIAEAEAPGRNRWIAVTGTNGKSTTTSWITDMLLRAGRRAALAGNIGAPLSGFLDEPRGRDYVCEVSSFQLETVERFRADVAVLTNVTPDHLDRYTSFAAYASAKARLFALQGADDAAVINADDPVSARIPIRARRLLFSRRGRVAGPGAWLEDGAIWSDASGERRLVLPAQELSLPGAHNVENALAAVAAVESLGVALEPIRASLAEFRGLPHRTELVAESGGVRWVDDSKGTNVDATAKSLEGFPPASVLLILGGRDKHGDFQALRPIVQRAVRRILTIGEAADPIEAALAGAAPVERCETMPRAVARAAALARPGDTVLLSPACASFDQYRNFEERGKHFAALARAAAEEMKGGSRG